MYIAEQQMVATAVGMQVLGWRPFASTFAAFLSRAYDFIRMSAISRASYCLCGSHAGISIGEDGPSQMALEDIASLRAVHGSTVLHPCDANQTAKLVEKMADTEGIVYLRTLRPDTPVIYGPDEDFEIGGSRTVRQGDDVAIVGAGITVHEALKAADALAAGGDRGARDRPLLDQAARRGDAALARRARSSPRRTTGRKAGSARPCCRRSGTPTTGRRWSGSRCTRCRTRASPPSCSPRPASTPTASRPPRASLARAHAGAS